MAKKKFKLLWIGHKSWLFSPIGVIYKTKKDAIRDGWVEPSRIRIELVKGKK